MTSKTFSETIEGTILASSQSRNAALRILHIFKPGGIGTITKAEAEWMPFTDFSSNEHFKSTIRDVVYDKRNHRGMYGEQLEALTAEKQATGFCGSNDNKICFILVHEADNGPDQMLKEIDEIRLEYANEKNVRFALLSNTPSLSTIFGEPLLSLGSEARVIAVKPKRKLWKMANEGDSIDTFVPNIVNNEELRASSSSVKKLVKPFDLAAVRHDEL